jgi:2-keto-4-pentenoate hydratase/2-oxohepta-3-ene-1,7-dioic acid hydratase in catechol pathway
MKLLRFEFGGEKKFGILEGGSICEIKGGLEDAANGNILYTKEEFDLNEVKILPPCEPSKIICLGLNYRGHAREMNIPLPEQPIIFIKPPTAVIGHGDTIIHPPQSRRVDYEAELGVVIGKMAHRTGKHQAPDHVLGYTCANDVTARDLQPKDGQWTYSKGFDTFSPLGPWIETDIKNPETLEVRGILNGVTVQSALTSEHIFGVSEIIAFISSCMTLLPGDVIMTGTPAGIGPLKPGDIFEVEISGIGKLENTIEKKE